MVCSSIDPTQAFADLTTVTKSDAILEYPAPYNAEHVGTIEVVILRCYPEPTDHKPSFKSRVRSGAPNHTPKAAKQATPGTSFDSSSDEAPDDNGPQSALGGLFDGAGDFSSVTPMSLCFGGDSTWEQNNNWNNEGQSSWNQGNEPQTGAGANSNPSEWDRVPATTQSPRWDTRRSSTSNHFEDDWNRPSQMPQNEVEQGSSHHSNHRSRRSGRSSSSQHNRSPVVGTTGDWTLGNAGQNSPAIVINVNHSPAPSRVGPQSVADSWATKPLPASSNQAPQGHVTSPNGSNKSGSIASGSDKSRSHHSGSNKSNGLQANYNGGDGWQATAGQTDNWGAEASNVPGSWDDPNNKPQDNWNGNDNVTGGPTNWDVQDQPQNGHSTAMDNTWGSGPANENWQNTTGNGSNGQNQGPNWMDDEVLKTYPEWASPTNQKQHGNSQDNNQMQQQNGWANGNDSKYSHVSGSSNGSGDNKKSEKLGLGLNLGSSPTKDEPIGMFGSKPIPASESVKREGSIKSKQSKHGFPFVYGVPQAQASTQPSEPALSYAGPVAPKPYWSTWNYDPLYEEPDIEDEPMEDPEPEEQEGPLYSVPAEIAERRHMSHQVQTGKPAVYLHKVSTPKYMDTHDRPYAAFTFNYRSRAVIEKMFNVSLAETEEEEKQRLSSLSKEELIEHYLKAKASTNSQKSASGSNDSVKRSDIVPEGQGFGGDLTSKLAQLSANKPRSEKASTDPELHWDRPPRNGNGWDNTAPTPHANVAGWLSNGGGGGAGSPPNNSGGSNKGHGNDHMNGSVQKNNNGDWNGNDGHQNKNGISRNNGGGSQHGGSWNNGHSGKIGSGSQNGKGPSITARRLSGGSWNTGANSNQRSSWKEGPNGNHDGSSWNNNGATEAPWNNGGGDASGVSNPNEGVQW